MSSGIQVCDGQFNNLLLLSLKIIIHLLGKILYLRVCVHRYIYLPSKFAYLHGRVIIF